MWVACGHMVMYCSRMATPQIAERTAQAIALAMVNQGVNKSELAEGAGIARSTLNRKLAGITPFDVAELWRISKVLGVSVIDLLPAEATLAKSA